MRIMKKVVCLILALVVCISLVYPVLTSDFKSSPEGGSFDCSNGHIFVNGVCTVCGAAEGVPETGDNNFLVFG